MNNFLGKKAASKNLTPLVKPSLIPKNDKKLINPALITKDYPTNDVNAPEFLDDIFDATKTGDDNGGVQASSENLSNPTC